MRLIGIVGGNSNAFTSFDETVYVNTVPSKHARDGALPRGRPHGELQGVDEKSTRPSGRSSPRNGGCARTSRYGTHVRGVPQERVHEAQLPLDADRQHGAPRRRPRSASCRSSSTSTTSRTTRSSSSPATSTSRKTKEMGPQILRLDPARARRERAEIPKEPEQTEAPAVDVPDRVPLPAVHDRVSHCRTTRPTTSTLWASSATSSSGGRSGRLDKELVYGAKPHGGQRRRRADGSWKMRASSPSSATVMQGKDPAAVEKALVDAIALVIDKGVTEEELEKAKTQRAYRPDPRPADGSAARDASSAMRPSSPTTPAA